MMAICIPSGMGHDHGGRPKPTPNFCSECGAKLGEKKDPKENITYDVFGGVSTASFIAGMRKAGDIMRTKPTCILCYPYLAEAAMELMREKPKPEPVGNFRQGDIVYYTEYPVWCRVIDVILCEGVASGLSYTLGRGTFRGSTCEPYSLRHVKKCEDGRFCDCPTCKDAKPKPEPVGNFKRGDDVWYGRFSDVLTIAPDSCHEFNKWSGLICHESKIPERCGHRYGPMYSQDLRHVHKCDDGRTCNCKTCNPCGKADDLDCTCEKCCPRTFGGLVDLFGADVVRERLVGMQKWSRGYDLKWLQRMICHGPNSNPGTIPVKGERARMTPSFYTSEAWQKLSETPCVFDGKNWTPKKGSES